MACYVGEISEPYRRKWERQTVSPDQSEPDVFDVITDMSYVGYRLDGCALECFTDCIQVDWGGWAYKATKAQMQEYNRRAHSMNRMTQEVVESLEDGRVYGVIDVELY